MADSEDTKEASFAEPEDLEARWHTLTGSERERASLLLVDASDKIMTDYPHAVNRVSATTLKRIVCQMVKRAMLASDERAGVSQMSQTTGSFADSFTFTNPDGDLYLTASERKSLTASSRRIFTVEMGE